MVYHPKYRGATSYGYRKRNRRGKFYPASRNQQIARHFRRKGYRKAFPQKLGWGKAVFPDRLKTKLFFAINGTLTSTSAALATVSYNLNSLYDIVGAGGTPPQPRYFDTLFGANNTTKPYIGYRVEGVKVSVKWYSDSSTTSLIAMGARDDNYSTAPSSMIECDERQLYKTKVLASNTGSNNVITMTRYFPMYRLAGVSKTQYNTDDDYRGTWTTNPSELLKLDLLTQASSGTRSVNYDLRLTFYTTCLYNADVADS